MSRCGEILLKKSTTFTLGKFIPFSPSNLPIFSNITYMFSPQ